jgi:uncharacterized protein (TIGR02569 family)
VVTDAPTAEILAAFGAADATPERLAGGEGRAWRAGNIVLKPETDEAVVAWLAAGVEQVADGPGFRMARHVAASDGRWVVGGGEIAWAATTFVEGAHGTARWDDVLEASRQFHAAIASVPLSAGGIPRTGSVWATGDRVAWGEEQLADDTPPTVRATLDTLQPVLHSPWTGAPSQVIHGDIGGNVVFADDLGLAPAVIDLSPYIRPAAFADAVVVVDAIAWEAAPITLAFRFGTTVDNGEELLARAIVYRLVTAAEAWRSFPERVDAEVEAYGRVLTAIQR